MAFGNHCSIMKKSLNVEKRSTKVTNLKQSTQVSKTSKLGNQHTPLIITKYQKREDEQGTSKRQLIMRASRVNQMQKKNCRTMLNRCAHPLDFKSKKFFLICLLPMNYNQQPKKKRRRSWSKMQRVKLSKRLFQTIHS